MSQHRLNLFIQPEHARRLDERKRSFEGVPCGRRRYPLGV